MNPQVTLGQIAKLEAELLALGRELQARGSRDAPAGAVASFATPPALPGDQYLRLQKRAYNSADPEIRALAMGALAYAQAHAEEHPLRARFGLRFAFNRISRMEGEAAPWSGVRVSENEEAEARELFELARGDRSYTDQQQHDSVHGFAEVHQADHGLLGEPSADLCRLLAVLEDSDPKRVETARAALTYFVLAADATPDQFGAWGLADDILVVRWATEELWPERKAVNRQLDSAFEDAPWLRDVEFCAAEASYPLSEYATVNSSFLVPGAVAAVLALGVTLGIHDTPPCDRVS